jgi:hypothetical protein
MTHKNLAAFARWFLAESIDGLRPPIDAAFSLVTSGGRIEGLTLYREDQFQVELFFAAPSPTGSGFPEHRHPNVDSIEYFLCGEIDFRIRGKGLPDDLIRGAAEDGAARLCGTMKRVRPTDWHGGRVGAKGGAFLSIQHWLNGTPPSSVVDDWIGPPHAEVITATGPGRLRGSSAAPAEAAPASKDYAPDPEVIGELESRLHYICFSAHHELGESMDKDLSESLSEAGELLEKIRVDMLGLQPHLGPRAS